jgi:hypothetical protein
LFKLSSEASTSCGFLSNALSRFLPRSIVPSTSADPNPIRAESVDPDASTSASLLISTATHALSTFTETVEDVVNTVKEVIESPVAAEKEDVSEQPDSNSDHESEESDEMAKSTKKYEVKAEPKREDDLSDIEDDDESDDQEYEVEAILDMRKAGVGLSHLTAENSADLIRKRQSVGLSVGC